MAKEKRGRRAIWKQTPEMERIAGHIGRFVDRLDPIDTLVTVGASYMGYQFNNDISGAILGAISYKLARARNIVAGAAGVAGLTLIGASLAAPTIVGVTENFKDQVRDQIGEFGKDFINIPYPDIDPADIVWKLPWDKCPAGYVEPRFLSNRCIRREVWLARKAKGGVG